MSPLKTYPDVEGGMRDWLRAQSAVTAVVGTRVFFGVPDNATFPLITIRQVAGGPDSSEAPFSNAMLQFDCWGGIKNKVQAASVMTALLSVLESFGTQSLNGSVVGYGARTESVVWLPDPADDRARYVVSATVTARAAA